MGPDAMMADVGGNVIALVFAALVALPVGPDSAAWRSDILLRDRSALAVAGTAIGTVLARVKALRDAATRFSGAEGGLDPGCAQRKQVAWATADGGSLGSDSGLPQRTRGLPIPERAMQPDPSYRTVALNGDLGVDSQLGKGSKFWLRLPRNIVSRGND